MKPYYEHGGITIYHGDCREILPLVNAHVLVTDPPYGVGLRTKSSQWTAEVSTLYADDPAEVKALLSQALPLALGRVDRAVVFPGPSMLFTYPEPAAIGCVYAPNGSGRCSWGFQCMHPVLFYGKDPYLQDGRGGRPNSMEVGDAKQAAPGGQAGSPLPQALRLDDLGDREIEQGR